MDSDPLPQVGMGLPEDSLLSRRLSLPPRAPYEAQGKALAAFAGYLRHKAAMHPSVRALRRIHCPVCGARIARRALKHACALRPSNLLRLAFSAAGGARLRSPLQGRLYRESLPPEKAPL